MNLIWNQRRANELLSSYHKKQTDETEIAVSYDISDEVIDQLCEREMFETITALPLLKRVLTHMQQGMLFRSMKVGERVARHRAKGNWVERQSRVNQCSANNTKSLVTNMNYKYRDSHTVIEGLFTDSFAHDTILNNTLLNLSVALN